MLELLKLNPADSYLTIIYKIIYPLGFCRKKQENLPDFDNGITCAFIDLKIAKARKPLILLQKTTPMNLSTGVLEQGYKDSNLEMTESESVISGAVWPGKSRGLESD